MPISHINIISFVQFLEKFILFLLWKKARIQSIDIGPDEMDLLEAPGPHELVLLLGPGSCHHGIISVDAEVGPIVSEPEV